jgi:hypothetical protein
MAALPAARTLEEYRNARRVFRLFMTGSSYVVDGLVARIRFGRQFITVKRIGPEEFSSGQSDRKQSIAPRMTFAVTPAGFRRVGVSLAHQETWIK